MRTSSYSHTIGSGEAISGVAGEGQVAVRAEELREANPGVMMAGWLAQEQLFVRVARTDSGSNSTGEEGDDVSS